MSATQPADKKYHHGDLAGALIDAALSLLAEKGPALLSLREVARLAGVSHGAPAHHFGDKAGLVQALLQEQLSEFTLFSDALAQPAEPDLSAWLGHVFIAAHNYFRRVLPLAGPQLSRGRPTRTVQSRDNFAGHTALSNRLVELQAQGVIQCDLDASAVALLLMGAAMHSALTTATLGDDALGGDDSLVLGVTATLSRLMAPRR